MPVYNAQAHLAESIQSFVDQSLKEADLICVDDGSTDSSPQILDSFRQRDPRIRVFTQSNQGAGAARNLALAHAQGDYVTFLDSDDYYPNGETLQALHALAERHSTKVAGGSLLFLDQNDLSRAKLGSNDFGFDEESVISYHDLQQAYYYQRFIYSRKMLDEAGIAFPPYRRFQDVVFFVRAMLEAERIAVTDMPSYVYRKSNRHAELTDEQVNDMLLGYIDVLGLAREHGLSRLGDFLATRLAKGGAAQKIVEDSIVRGNEAARRHYDEALALVEQTPPKSTPKQEQPDLLRKIARKLRALLGH